MSDRIRSAYGAELLTPAVTSIRDIALVDAQEASRPYESLDWTHGFHGGGCSFHARIVNGYRVVVTDRKFMADIAPGSRYSATVDGAVWESHHADLEEAKEAVSAAVVGLPFGAVEGAWRRCADDSGWHRIENGMHLFVWGEHADWCLAAGGLSLQGLPSRALALELAVRHAYDLVGVDKIDAEEELRRLILESEDPTALIAGLRRVATMGPEERAEFFLEASSRPLPNVEA